MLYSTLSPHTLCPQNEEYFRILKSIKEYPLLAPFSSNLSTCYPFFGLSKLWFDILPLKSPKLSCCTPQMRTLLNTLSVFNTLYQDCVHVKEYWRVWYTCAVWYTSIIIEVYDTRVSYTYTSIIEVYHTRVSHVLKCIEVYRRVSTCIRIKGAQQWNLGDFGLKASNHSILRL